MCVTRRRFLRQGLGATVLATVTMGSTMNVAHGASESVGNGNGSPYEDLLQVADDSRRLRLINVHTGEKISVVYWHRGVYLDDSLEKINFLMRDFRANEVMQIDRRVIDYLYRMYTEIGSTKHIQILSGYRSPATNEMLRTRSSLSGVAKNSLHIVGRAIDFRIPGTPTRRLQQTALDLKIGGIGYYRRSDFVHIDSGSHRSWS